MKFKILFVGDSYLVIRKRRVVASCETFVPDLVRQLLIANGTITKFQEAIFFWDYRK